jgi:hypothetical protein
MIFKLQRPLYPDTKDQPLLAYTEGRQNRMEISPTPQLVRMFGRKMKIYVEANIVAGKLDVSAVVPDQSW